MRPTHPSIPRSKWSTHLVKDFVVKVRHRDLRRPAIVIIFPALSTRCLSMGAGIADIMNGSAKIPEWMLNITIRRKSESLITVGGDASIECVDQSTLDHHEPNVDMIARTIDVIWFAMLDHYDASMVAEP